MIKVVKLVDWAKEKEFFCNSCHYTYQEEFFAVENAKDGKVCRFCWEKKLKEKEN